MFSVEREIWPVGHVQGTGRQEAWVPEHLCPNLVTTAVFI